MTELSKEKDSDALKGTVESDRPSTGSTSTLSGQIGHRDSDELLKDSDTDFPEPDAEAEHSGGKH